MSLNFSEEEKKEIAEELNEISHISLSLLKQTIQAYISWKDAPVITVGDKVYDMKEYTTISEYAKLFGYKSTMVVTNQIRRNVIRSERVAFIPSLEIKLIKLI